VLLPPHLHVSVLPDEMAVARLPAGSDLPSLPAARDGVLVSITVTSEEVSLIAPVDLVPEGAESDQGWRALKVEGPLKLDQVGLLASLLDPLMAAQVSVVALSTFETEYVMVKEEQLRPALAALRVEGHRVDVLPGF
jgi:hypothetical protein